MTKKYRHGLVPLSADPVTLGHVDLVTQAVALCERVTVYVSHNDNKAGQYTFSLEERAGLTSRALAHLAPLVEVVMGYTLLTDTFLERGCDMLVRGIRNEVDKAYEDEQLAYHALVYPAIAEQAIYVEARPELAVVSSSLVKAFVAHGVDVSGMVPVEVQALLEQRLRGQYLIGVTGQMASGKSTLVRELVLQCTALDIPAMHMDVDALSRNALFDESPGGELLRTAIAGVVEQADLFTGSHEEVLARFRAVFFSEVLSNDARERVHELVRPHVERLYRKVTAGFHGVIFYEWAQLVEMDMLAKVHNTVVLVESPDRKAFASARGVSDAQYTHVQALQMSADTKAQAISARIETDGYGCLVRVANTRDVPPVDLAKKVLAVLCDMQAVPCDHNDGGAT